MELCPCGSQQAFATCCEPFILEKTFPNTPEELMRSRYAAYVKADLTYIAKTMMGPAAVDFSIEDAKQSAAHIKWLGLKILRSQHDNEKGIVEFMASYSLMNNAETIYEISEFRKVDGRWFYYDGATPKIGRNDSCPCGSGKKFKKCCAN